MRYLFVLIFIIQSINPVFSQNPIESWSYTNSHPGNKELFRDYPGFTPQLSGAAQNKRIPTNDWWSLLLKENHVNNLFNYPFTMRTTKYLVLL